VRRKLHEEELNDLYSSPNIIPGDQIDENDMGGNVARMGERGSAYRVLVGNLKEGDLLKDPGVDGRI